jgi:beta-mannosidase
MSRVALDTSWEFVSSPAGVSPVPPEDGWRPAIVPGTVASSLRALNDLSFEHTCDFDAQDHWYRCEFPSSTTDEHSRRAILHFGGLATTAEAWLNGSRVLESANMFRAHAIDVTRCLQARNTLLLRFAALGPQLKLKRPRPRWKTRLVEEQQLRWFRTSLIGRTPGWSPPLAPVGPWRAIWLETDARVSVESLSMNAQVQNGDGAVTVDCRVTADERPQGGRFTVAAVSGDLDIQELGRGQYALRGRVALSNPALWWPHTHGEPVLHDSALAVQFGTREEKVPTPRIGFRTIECDNTDGGFRLRVNGVRIFARGACWTVSDALALTTSPAEYRRVLGDVKAAGMNMLRVGGTFVYEDDAFYALCDELGILVWQDFMFANMDFPFDDPSFADDVRIEAMQLLRRISVRPSLAVLCGNSEVEQQASMLGLPRSLWRHSFFGTTLPAWCSDLAPGVPYVPSTPSGGVLPFHVNQGVGHYYGVGAYMRALEDVKCANVRFASECLAFANLPCRATIDELLPGGDAAAHTPLWKRRVPRDRGTIWDFEDIRDHYVERLFHVRANDLRFVDGRRYLSLGRAAVVEVMTRTVLHWRQAGSECAGGLVWFYKDLWPGAGWGVVDAMGRPKSSYYGLKRAMAPVAVSFSDEGVNGLHVHVANDPADPFDGQLRFRALREGITSVIDVTRDVHVPGHGHVSLVVDELLGYFADANYAYRFGPPSHDVSILELIPLGAKRPVASAHYFPIGLALPVQPDVGLEADWVPGTPVPTLTLSTQRFAQFVELDVDGYEASDNYFHLAPGTPVNITLQPSGSRGIGPSGTIGALNSLATIPIRGPVTP